jgi:hypothetical protein
MYTLTFPEKVAEKQLDNLLHSIIAAISEHPEGIVFDLSRVELSLIKSSWFFRL